MRAKFLTADEVYPPYELAAGEFVDFVDLDEVQLRRLRKRVSFHGDIHGKRFSVKRTHPVLKNYRCWRVE